MAGRGAAGPTRQELIRRSRRSGFVGRRAEIAGFRAALEQPPDAAEHFLFHVRGPAGVGKSTLIRQLESVALSAGATTVYADESIADAVELMEAIALQLGRQGLALKNFDRRLAEYRRLRHEAAAGLVRPAAEAAEAEGPAEGEVPGGAGAQGRGPSAPSLVAARLGLAGLGLVPGVGPFAGAMDAAQLAAGADRVRALFASRQRSHEDLSLVLSPLTVLTPVFLSDLAEAAAGRPWIVWFLDTYERTGPSLDNWLRDVLVTGRYGELPGTVLVVLAGQSRLDPACWGDWRDLVTDWPLEVFTQEEARALLSARGVTDERVVRVILDLSGRLPVLVTTLAQNRPSDVAGIGDPSGTAVERFLRWAPGAAHREAALTCALPRELDEDVFRAAVPGADPGLYGWLRAQPFVTDRAGRCRYHDVVRAPMLRLRRRHSPARWRAEHERLAGAFRALRAEADSGWREEEWREEQWREHRLQETYHLLCADPRAALARALREVLTAYDKAPRGVSRRWAETVAEAGRDTENGMLARTGAELLSAYARSETAALSWLLTHGGFDAPGRALALSLRGREHRDLERYDEALADYDAALALDPGLDWAWSGRGRTYLAVGRFDEALTDFDRALEIAPDIAVIVANRGEALRRLGRAQEAVADLDRALDLRPDFAWAWAGKGAALRLLGRHEEAVVCLDRAIGLQPDYAWAHRQRGILHRYANRFEAALADHDRAVELAPENPEFHIQRGMTLRFSGRFPEALEEFDRGLAAEPDNGWALAQRGEAHRLAGRPERAVEDLRRAVELDPDYTWAWVMLSETRLGAGRPAEALADLDRACAAVPDDPWLLVKRGDRHLADGRGERAFADFDRALDAAPDDRLARWARASAHMAHGHLDAALSDVSHLLRADPADLPTLRFRALVHELADRVEEALDDLGRAHALDARDAATLMVRADVLQRAGRHREALADLDRALALRPGAGEQTEILVCRSLSRFRLHQYASALDDLERALALTPDLAAAHGHRALVRWARGDRDAARADLVAACRLAPGESDAPYYLALAHRAEAPEAAVRGLERVVELAVPDFGGTGVHRGWAEGLVFLTHCAREQLTRAEVDGDAAAVGGGAAAVDGDAAAVGGDAAAVDGDAAAVGGDAAAVDGDAAAALTRFLDCRPLRHKLREVLDDLTDQVALFGFSEAPLRPHRARLEAALTPTGPFPARPLPREGPSREGPLGATRPPRG